MTFPSISCRALLLAAALLAGSGCSGGDRPPAEAARTADRSAPAPGAADSTAALCAGHGVPASVCFLCDPARREAGRLWCTEHARYEDRCWLCHPDLRDAARLYCEEHGLYEDECFYCHPEVLARTAPADARSEAHPGGDGLQCTEHGVPEAECGICHPELAAGMTPGQGLKVRFASPEAAATAGIETAPPGVGPTADGITCYAEIVFDQNRLARIAPPADGILRSVEVDLGDRVASGQVLAAVWSSAIGDAVARAVLARQSLDRERSLHARQVSSEKTLEEAEAAYGASRQELRTLGFDDRRIEELVSNSVDTAMLEMRAPFAGEIVERAAVRGEMVHAGTPLFTLVDRSTMWAMLSIPERDLSRARVGQQVDLQVDALPDRRFTGVLTWIAPRVDDRTRMAQARAEIADPQGVLADNMFATARIVTGHADHSVLVPAGAVQRIGDRDFVFVKLADDLFEARRVRVGTSGDGLTALAEGLGLHESVVVRGTFLARSQFLISKLGAGCAD